MRNECLGRVTSRSLVARGSFLFWWQDWLGFSLVWRRDKQCPKHRLFKRPLPRNRICRTG